MKHPDFRSPQFLQLVIAQVAARGGAPGPSPLEDLQAPQSAFKATLEAWMKRREPALLDSSVTLARSATAGITPRSSPRHGRFDTGTLARWSRYLLTLERNVPDAGEDNWMSHRARELFAAAVEHGWDRSHDGLVAAFGHDDHGRVVVLDPHKPLWVQAETIAAAAELGERFGDGGYWSWYDRLWAYCWRHHEHDADDSLRAACYAAIAALEA